MTFARTVVKVARIFPKVEIRLREISSRVAKEEPFLSVVPKVSRSKAAEQISVYAKFDGVQHAGGARHFGKWAEKGER